jgi:hypothetical protein
MPMPYRVHPYPTSYPTSEVVENTKKKLFEELKRVLGSLPTRLPEHDVIELARAAWREAVIEDVQISSLLMTLFCHGMLYGLLSYTC